MGEAYPLLDYLFDSKRTPEEIIEAMAHFGYSVGVWHASIVSSVMRGYEVVLTKNVYPPERITEGGDSRYAAQGYVLKEVLLAAVDQLVENNTYLRVVTYTPVSVPT